MNKLQSVSDEVLNNLNLLELRAEQTIMQWHDGEFNKIREVDAQLWKLNKAIPLHLPYWLSLFMSCEFQS